MATVSLTHVIRGQFLARRITGAATGNAYVADQLGRVTVDATDAPALIANGSFAYTNPADAGGGGFPSYGIAIVDFGAFPGKPLAEVAVTVGAVDLNVPVDVDVTAVASVDHTADEHSVDPPMVSAQLSGATLTIRANCSGRDLPVPPGIPFGNTANSQRPIARRQLQPYGKWNVAWTLVA